MRMMRKRWLWVPLVVLATGCGYNRIQALDEATTEMRANIDAELLRRNDLIPNLVATVEQAASFEQKTFTGIAEARAGLTRARDQVASAVQGGAGAEELGRASAALTDQLRMFVSVAVEAYPSLTATKNFQGLQDELTETENKVAVARRDYNEAVRIYNTYIRQYPQALTARITGAERKSPLEAPAGVEQAPKVQFREN